MLNGFKAARLFDSGKVNEIKPTGTDVDKLKVFPFFSLSRTKNQVACLFIWQRLEVCVSAEMNKLEWWKIHENELPKWSSACKQVLLIQPSSGAAERVFSLLVNSFTDQQTRLLEDYVETFIMMQYNKTLTNI